MSSAHPPLGRLVIVGTPIGNLADLSPRATEALSQADVIACEDTRRTGRLLSAIGVEPTQLVVVNDHTETRKAPVLVERMIEGATVVLVTDAGMPAVSDPGAELVAAARDAGVTVTVVPGATAGSAALAASGLPSGRWVFEGFLPRQGSARKLRLAAVAEEERTLVLYEAPHRMARTVSDLLDECDSDRVVVIGREITKLYEEWFRGTLQEASDWLAESEPRGEYVIVLAGAVPPADATDEDLLAALGREQSAGISTRDAVQAVADTYGVGRRRVYELANASRSD